MTRPTREPSCYPTCGPATSQHGDGIVLPFPSASRWRCEQTATPNTTLTIRCAVFSARGSRGELRVRQRKHRDERPGREERQTSTFSCIQITRVGATHLLSGALANTLPDFRVYSPPVRHFVNIRPGILNSVDIYATDVASLPLLGHLSQSKHFFSQLEFSCGLQP